MTGTNYESLHWRAIEEWLVEHPEHSHADELRAEHERYGELPARHARAARRRRLPRRKA